MNLVDAAAEMTGHVPRLSFLLAKKLVNRAWRDILDERLWTFTVEEGAFLAPQLVTSGLVTVTLGSNLVVGDATARTAWDAIALDAVNPIIKRQFRLNTSGPLYNITAYNSGTITLTLDRPYLEPTQAAINYRIYRTYFEPPDDFRSFITMVNHVDGYPLRLHWTRKEIDIRDPTRGAHGLAYYFSSYKVKADGRPIYELWPHTTSERTYSFVYQRQGVVLTDTDPKSVSRRICAETGSLEGPRETFRGTPPPRRFCWCAGLSQQRARPLPLRPAHSSLHSRNRERREPQRAYH